MSDGPLIDVRDLHVSFRTEDGVVPAVDGVSFTVSRGEVLGIVGESGSGKSVTAMTLMRLIRDPNATFSGQVLFKGRDLMELSTHEMQLVRGAQISMIFQDPMTSLNPVYRIGWQIEEQLRAHEQLTREQARARALELLAAVGIPNPRARIDDYPHQFSGGMRQRAMIAMGISCNPDVLIADEPTTALDVTIQAQILELIGKLQGEFGSAVVLITHDMGVVAEVADRVAVMYAGRIVEYAGVRELFRDPQHPYTWGLLGSISRLDRPRQSRLSAIAGQPPSLLRLPAGCSFRPRCPYAFERCERDDPALERRSAGGHLDACMPSAEQKQDRRPATVVPT
jgi:oligopeptide/dipeptide ABC transporter ATP-binding protein